MVTSLTCYNCGTGSCNDPFSSSGQGTMGSCGACVKSGVLGTITRSCAGSCPTVSAWVSGTGVSCCSDKDYCNGAWRSHDYSFALTGLIATLLVVLKIKCF
ncbi:unnamed protein product [Adineta steineri]|uniref:Snake toxin/toxin-like domain-containing protein n=1 Tax=Adineta steineri TaxID=433720 RepID=A0A819HV60_9BILA|nr:unnamed protein product [Adineta steineri]CAF3903109.1 unnamed protein product [Adineta steineri]